MEKNKTNIVDEIVCVKYRLMPDILLKSYASKNLTAAEHAVIRQEMIQRGLVR